MAAAWLLCRRQALDRGGVLERANKIATGHNADDIAETVLLNMIRGDVPRRAHVILFDLFVRCQVAGLLLPRFRTAALSVSTVTQGSATSHRPVLMYYVLCSPMTA
jgi:hypothetical protein